LLIVEQECEEHGVLVAIWDTAAAKAAVVKPQPPSIAPVRPVVRPVRPVDRSVRRQFDRPSTPRANSLFPPDDRVDLPLLELHNHERVARSTLERTEAVAFMSLAHSLVPKVFVEPTWAAGDTWLTKELTPTKPLCHNLDRSSPRWSSSASKARWSAPLNCAK
jgi:hypothetical protein